MRKKDREEQNEEDKWYRPFPRGDRGDPKNPEKYHCCIEEGSDKIEWRGIGICPVHRNPACDSEDDEDA